MADSKAAAELIRKLRKMGYEVVPQGKRRAKVIAGDRHVIIPGEMQRTAGSAMANARALLRRELGIDI